MTSTPNGHPVLVIVGMPGAGKSVASTHIRDRHGWRHIRFGQVTIDEVVKRGLPITEYTERQVREEIRARGGMDAYARLLWPDIKAALTTHNLVLDGLYSWSEYRFLRDHLPNAMVVLAIVAARHLRYERLAARSVRPLSEADAEARDVAEIERLEKGGPIAMADFTIVNDESDDVLMEEVDRFLHRVMKPRS